MTRHDACMTHLLGPAVMPKLLKSIRKRLFMTPMTHLFIKTLDKKTKVNITGKGLEVSRHASYASCGVMVEFLGTDPEPPLIDHCFCLEREEKVYGIFESENRWSALASPHTRVTPLKPNPSSVFRVYEGDELRYVGVVDKPHDASDLLCAIGVAIEKLGRKAKVKNPAPLIQDTISEVLCG